jgi:primase-polymerase (primpol)-like protein
VRAGTASRRTLKSQTDKPRFLEPIKENIHKELKQRIQWVVWKAEFVDGKWTKVPYNAQSGYKAASDNPKTWSSFNTAYYKYKNSNGEYDGIGFVVSKDDPFTGIDLDKCRDPKTGNIDLWAEKIIQKLNSYTEISPSGNGIRIFIRAKLPQEGRKKNNIEMYDQGHYLTITGNRANGTGHD